ncbi:uncharacterized protein [Diadema antillarum]|uniref:uncharacterized protein n=1 Tax=Diadema antillarum TaxID=105358 RepID=UPI003A84A5ED
MSAPVRTSSRIKERKSKIVPNDKDVSTPNRKRKNTKEETSAGPQISPISAKKHAGPTLAAPSPGRLASTPAGAPSNTQTTRPTAPATSVSLPPGNVAAPSTTTTMSTRSSHRLAPREDASADPPKQGQLATSLSSSKSTTVPTTSAQSLDTAGVPAGKNLTASSLALEPQQPTLPPTHIFKNPNFTHSSRGGTSTGKKTRTWKTLKQIIASERAQLHRPIGSTYSSIDAPPSMKPPKKYSDISGLPAKYTDPRTKLRYATTEEFAQLRMLPTDIVNGLLALRRANIDVQ